MSRPKNTSFSKETVPGGNYQGYFGQNSLQKAADLYAEMQKPMVTGAKLGYTSRTLWYWKENIDMNIEVGVKKYYNFYEIIWLRIVEQLVASHFPMAAINNIYAQLSKPLNLKGVLSQQDKIDQLLDQSQLSKKQKQELLSLLNVAKNLPPEPLQINLLHILIMETIIKKLPLAIAVFLDSSLQVLDRTKGFLYSEAEQNRILYQTHTVISIAGIIRNFLSSELSALVLPNISILPPAENRLFDYLHSGQYETITIAFRDNKLPDVELKKSKNIKDRIVDIIYSGNYSRIAVNRTGGEIEILENTTKITL